ncbi:DNA polymerase alpha/epsilon subunit B-domain-containing protein [Melanogaster broomeanus]|nr:DNA polymerase alpha/epsilon subunit B-domain-containing protein [Melanogaster broomeanus]
MSAEDFRNEIAQHFTEAVAADDALVKECMTMCKMYNLTVENLLYKWQALSYSTTNSVTIFTLKSVPDLRAMLHQELGRTNASKQEATSRNVATVKFGRGTGKARGLMKPSIARSLDATLNLGPVPLSMIKSGARDPAGPSRILFRGPKMDPQSQKSRAYRYMYEKVSERSEALDDRIDEFADLISRYYHIDELADPDAATEESTTVVGRIVLDSGISASGAKLNESSLVLESSRMMGSGVRVPIRLTPETKIRGGIKGLGCISFFPGAIVALRGRNGGGGFFLAEEILALPPNKTPSPPPNDASAAFSMCIACGPFTVDSDLEYKPWANLLDTLKATKPAVVLLIGPFVDATNSLVKDGEMDESPDNLFQRQFMEKLKGFLTHSPGSTVLLVPSTNDIISDHAVFPQCELGIEFSSDPRIHLLSNPCRFSVNGLFFGVSSVDVLFHLRKEEFLRRAPEIDPLIPKSEPATDAMSNLARNIMQQRSFYPLFPVPFDLAHEVNLDVTHSEGLRLVENEDESVPDVLVLPSRLKQFSKVVDASTVINPSFLSKGTYATLSYTGQASGLVKDCVTVDISRI